MPPKKDAGKVLQGELQDQVKNLYRCPYRSESNLINTKLYMQEGKSMARKVLVMGEVRDGSLRNVSFEAVAAAKQLQKAVK